MNYEPITEAEDRVVEKITLGYNEKMAADALCLSPKTVHNHTYNVRKKWNAKNNVDLARIYILTHKDKFFTPLVFLMLQLGITFTPTDLNVMRPARRGKGRRYEYVVESDNDNKLYN